MKKKQSPKNFIQSRAPQILPPSEELNINYQEILTKQSLRIMLPALILASLIAMVYSILDGRILWCIIPHLFIVPVYTAFYLIVVKIKKANPMVIAVAAVSIYAFIIFPGIWMVLTFIHPMVVGLAVFISITTILLFDGKTKRTLTILIMFMLLAFMAIDIANSIIASGTYGNSQTGAYLGILLTIGMVVYCTDGLKKKFSRMNANLQKFAVTDSLTGAFNSRMMSEILERYLKVFQETGKVFSVAALDLDEFKRINDLFGHGTGDDYLVATVNVLQDSLREGDVLARTGGDEFAIILPNCTAMQAKRIVQRLLKTVEEVETMEPVKRITFSAGVTDCVEAKRLNKDILKIADQKLYHSKALGRNTVYAGSLQEKQDQASVEV